MSPTQKLGRTDWIQAAFRALTVQGDAGVRIEPIARALGVSKGSFYWHFKDLKALHNEMLQHWHNVATQSIIDTVEQSESSPEARLRLLVKHASAAAPDLYGGVEVEPALRAWARHNAIAADTIKTVDALRLNYLRRVFKETGCSPAESTRHANVLYATLIGLESLSKQRGINRSRELTAVLNKLLDRNLS